MLKMKSHTEPTETTPKAPGHQTPLTKKQSDDFQAPRHMQVRFPAKCLATRIELPLLPLSSLQSLAWVVFSLAVSDVCFSLSPPCPPDYMPDPSRAALLL